jgi:hypothetical protein
MTGIGESLPGRVKVAGLVRKSRARKVAEFIACAALSFGIVGMPFFYFFGG